MGRTTNIPVICRPVQSLWSTVISHSLASIRLILADTGAAPARPVFLCCQQTQSMSIVGNNDPVANNDLDNTFSYLFCYTSSPEPKSFVHNFLRMLQTFFSEKEDTYIHRTR